MYEKKISISKEKKYKIKGKVAIFLALILVFNMLLYSHSIGAGGASVATFEGAESQGEQEVHRRILEAQNITEEQLRMLEYMEDQKRAHGLVGFEGEYELEDGDKGVDVIVLFDVEPPKVQVIKSALEGYELSYEEAIRTVKEKHCQFVQELEVLFSPQDSSDLMRTSVPYYINQVFQHAFSGMAMTVQSSMLEDIANLEMVKMIVPDTSVNLPDLSDEAPSTGEHFGMSQGRARMNAHELHNRGYTGEGVVIAVIDSGIDWMHPTFAGTFPTIEEMQQRNPAITNAHGINIDGRYYFVGRDFIRLWPGGEGDDFRGNPTTLLPGEPGNDPMEFSPIHFPVRGDELRDNAGAIPNYSSHGTHVAGTIVGQPVYEKVEPSTGELIFDYEHTILGVAPDARVIHYRALFGSTPISVVLASMEKTYFDSPDVVNMSLSGGMAHPQAIQNIAINNLMLQNPNKVFVVSAGNTGPNLYTVGNPSGATMAITVSNLTEQETFVGANLNSGTNVDTTAFPLMNNPAAQWIVGNDGSIINTFYRLANHDGEYRIFALPDFGSRAATGTEDINIGSAYGAGFAESFVDLFITYDPELLKGAFILVRRPTDDNTGLQNAPLIGFNPGIIGFPPGMFDLLGGVIVVDGTAPNRTSPRNLLNLSNIVPTLIIDNESGRLLLENIVEGDTDYGTFTLNGELVKQTVAGTSSRGPTGNSFEIKPDVGAHGTDVFSAVPRWVVGEMNNPHWADVAWAAAYDFRTGSSMSTPHVTGGVALMIQYSQANHTRWDSQEIKSRIMNTAIDLDYEGNNYGVFDGARQMDVWAAVRADTVVSVHFPRVVVTPEVPFEDQPFETAKTGSFSFGGFNRHGNSEGMRESLTATVTNRSNRPRAYFITHEFITTGRNSLSGATLNHPLFIRVPANGSADFIATLNIPAGDALGHYEGFVIVSYNNQVVARIPFAGVTIDQPPTLYSVVPYRPVISTGEHAQNMTSSELVVSYKANFGFSTTLHLVRAVPEINAHNWRNPEFTEAVLGTIGGSRFFSATQGHIQPGETKRGVIFNGRYTPVGSNTPVILQEEGDFYIIIEVWRQNPNRVNTWAWEMNKKIPFSVDNTPPKFTSLSINGVDIDMTEESSTLQIEASMTVETGNVALSSSGEIYITGNVHDEWLTQAMGRGTRFDVWLETKPGQSGSINPYGPELSIPNNLALWALAGENEPGNRPTLVELKPCGDFSITLMKSEGEDSTDIRLWLMDGYAPVPSVNQQPFGTNSWDVLGGFRVTPGTSEHFEFPGGGVWVDEEITSFLRKEPIYSWTSLQMPREVFGWFDWSGLNLTQLEINLQHKESNQEVFSFQIFNNGVINNQSLYNSGIIRMWTQINGLNTLVPFADLELTARLPSGEDAMRFITVNRPWVNQAYVNFIDANMNGNWQRIYLTATLRGQSIEVVLVNIQYQPTILSLDIFNNGAGGSPSRPNPGLGTIIRMWTQINGVNTPVTYRDVTVTAQLPSGECAMRFVTINRPWVAQDTVNFIDVNRNGSWERIYLSLTAYGQTITVILSNL